MKSNAIAVALVLASLVSACSRSAPASAAAPIAAAPKPSTPKRYDLHGEVISVDATRHVLVVKRVQLVPFVRTDSA